MTANPKTANLLTETSLLVSVVMPAYNAAEFIRESIESVLQQTYAKWELIIVNDGATDKTAPIVKNFTSKDSRIIYIEQSNGKQGKARNTAIKISRGKLIAFLDADDRWLPHKLEKQIAQINAANADVVFSDVVIIDENGKQIKETWGSKEERFEGDAGMLAFLHDNRIPLLSVLAKKESILAADCFKESTVLQYGEDYDLWIRMLQKGFVFVGSSDKLAEYRMHKKQATVNKTAMLQMISTIKTIHIAEKNLLKEKNRLLKFRIRKFIKTCSPHITRYELKQVISLFPFTIERHFFLLLNRFMNQDMLTELILLYCKKAVNSKTYS